MDCDFKKGTFKTSYLLSIQLTGEQQGHFL